MFAPTHLIFLENSRATRPLTQQWLSHGWKRSVEFGRFSQHGATIDECSENFMHVSLF
jgi:hypothetical protein